MNANDLITELAPVFALATTGFDAFYKKVHDKSAGDGSQSASAGYGSQSASSGYGSQSASSGYDSQSASAGDGSKSASAGDDSHSASSGYGSQSASAGNYSQSASSGYGSKSASSGYGSQSASSGYGSQSASAGNYSQSASAGDDSQSASSGDYSQSASSGYDSQSASAGDGSQSASSGDDSHSASSGYGSRSASSGQHSACAAVGARAAVSGDLGNLLMCSEYVDGKPVGGLAALVDGEKLKPRCWYIVEGGKFVEVDFSDNVFAYVVKTKGPVKQVRTPGGVLLYVVGDGNGNFAHGRTIKEAREDLVYKITAKFEGELPQMATGADWVGIYRAVTGACGTGCKDFVTRNKIDLAATYTPQQVAELTRGAYNSEKLAALIGGKV